MIPRARGFGRQEASGSRRAPTLLSTCLSVPLSPAPTVPRDVISMSNSSSHLIVRWKPPTHHNGNLTYYLILWQQLAEDAELYINDYCHKGEEGRAPPGAAGASPGPLAGDGPRPLSLTPPPLSHPCWGTGLRLPTSSADTRFDTDGSEGLGGAEEEHCCPCHSPVGQPPLQPESFQKRFEDFLHHAIIMPRWGAGAGSQSSTGAGGGALWGSGRGGGQDHHLLALEGLPCRGWPGAVSCCPRRPGQDQRVGRVFSSTWGRTPWQSSPHPPVGGRGFLPGRW